MVINNTKQYDNIWNWIEQTYRKPFFKTTI